MPKGYEDVRKYKDLVARKKQLDGPASRHATTFSRTSGSSHGHVGSKSVHSTLTRPTSDSMTSNDLTPSRKFSSTTLASIPGARHKKPETDSIIRERQRERWRRWQARLRLKPEAYRAYLDGLSTAAMKRRDKDPAYRERKKDRDRASTEKARLDSPGYNVKDKFRSMVLRHSWTRTDLPWKLYSTRIRNINLGGLIYPLKPRHLPAQHVYLIRRLILDLSTLVWCRLDHECLDIWRRATPRQGRLRTVIRVDGEVSFLVTA
jgi:hypothetical protein